MKNIIPIIFLFSFAITACEEPFDIDVETGEIQMVVDAFLTTQTETQTVKLSETVDFFEANQAPGISNAQVGVFNINQNKLFLFQHDSINTGSYNWTPPALTDTSSSADSSLGAIGDILNLIIVHEGDTFQSVSEIKRTAPIDSIAFVFEEGGSFNDEGYVAELKASDLEGEGDIYWIRTWINGIYLGKAAEINVAYDASFTPGSDNIPFIFPIRRSINPVEDTDEEVDKRTQNADLLPEAPYEVGDSIYVEIWSINEATFFFLQQIQAEVNNGGLFATPPTNVRTNIFNINENKDRQVVGHFNVSEVSSAWNVLDENGL